MVTHRSVEHVLGAIRPPTVPLLGAALLFCVQQSLHACSDMRSFNCAKDHCVHSTEHIFQLDFAPHQQEDAVQNHSANARILPVSNLWITAERHQPRFAL
jgi:hypothetical protein